MCGVGMGLKNLQWAQMVVQVKDGRLFLWYWNGEGRMRHRWGLLVRMLVHCYQYKHSYSMGHLQICILIQREHDTDNEIIRMMVITMTGDN